MFRSKVLDRNEAEEQRMLFRKLPESLQRQVMQEQAKRRDRKPWVRVVIPAGYSSDALTTLIEDRLQEPMPPVWLVGSSMIVQVHDEEQQEELLRLHNAQFNEVSLKVSRYQYEMSGDKILAFINRRLTTEEDLQAARRACGQSPAGVSKTSSVLTQPTTPAMLKAVQSEEPNLQQVSTSGRGFSPRRQSGKRDAKSRSRSTPPKSPTSPGECRCCRKAGRAYVHDWKKCEHAWKALKEAGRDQWMRCVVEGKCWTCVQANRPADHDHRKCSHAKSDREKRAAQRGSRSPGNRSE